MTNKIIALGGTGQMVLNYYLQLYLLGVVDEPFDAVVIDTDETIPSLRVASEYLALIGQENGAVPNLQMVKLATNGAASAFELLTGIHPEQAPPLVPAQAFFDSETLGMDLTNGLFARPALSAVVALDAIEERSIVPDNGATVVVVGSVIGGTGGGLVEPVIDLIRRYLDINQISAKIRAVLFGEYFEPDPGRIDLRRLQSNQVLVLRTAKEALSELHSYAVVGGPGEPKIAKMADKNQGHIAWPDADISPFWRGVQCLHYMLHDQIMSQNRDFRQREVSTVPDALDLKRSRQRLSDAVHVMEALTKRDVIRRLEKEPWLSYIWGQGLSQLVCHYWRIAAKLSGEWERVSDFPTLLQRSLEIMWNGAPQKPGLSSVFPNASARHVVRPRSFRRTPFAEVERSTSWNRATFDSPGTAAMRCAASISFAALRKGN